MADKFEKFAELIEDRQEDIDEAVETVREIGRISESTGRRTGGIVGIRADGSTYDRRVGAIPLLPPPLPPSESNDELNVTGSLFETIDAAVRDMIDRLEDEELDETPPAPPIQQPSPEEVANLAVAIINSQSETPDESVCFRNDSTEAAEESSTGLLFWLPWAMLGGVGIWGFNRKTK
ncbi:MAG: hypothetical protein IID46_04670 [Planctomycetes bacterium]|nr:hypothetical protein [Planctomycetota bacterium]